LKILPFYALSFYSSHNVLCRSKFFWASSKIWLHLVPLQNLLCRHKNQFYWVQIIFLSGKKSLQLPQCVSKFLVWHKKFGPAQNILGLVKGQGINRYLSIFLSRIYSRLWQPKMLKIVYKWKKQPNSIQECKSIEEVHWSKKQIIM
jgi:hypothetical protein